MASALAPTACGGVTAISYTGPALTSATVPLVYTFDDATDTLTATAGARTVFTLVVNEVAGTWTFTLLDHLDHPTVSTEDNLVLSFSATVTDGDGDAVVQALSVNVDDDMPTLGTAGTLAVDEDDLTVPPASFAGNSDVTRRRRPRRSFADQRERIAWRVSFGADGVGGVTAISYTGPALTSATVPLVYTFDDATDTLTATAGAQTVFTLVVDEVAGTWTFTLLDHLDHPSGLDRGQPRSHLQCDGDGRRRRCGDSGAVGQCRRRHADAWHGRHAGC